ncbi:hypothetical protein GCM10010211_48940 [Streptomyces albospinus]|uniref:Uncharacterized protein n=2 Tax=Streptomyces TaxID=1883 RepID=A0A101PBR3_9ACTN|nr:MULTISPECIES: hypothetical protein [Streptomyces]KUN08586.1 hypothetical protein AQI95_09530 [Streptomyces yokosukanensis]GGU77234.1 hypothetical protein GCM10010211_48940 [Streptomyces albospinus]
MPTAMSTAYTVPNAGLAVVTNIVATNPSPTASASVTVRLGGVPLLSGVGIAPSGVLTLDLRQVLTSGDTIEIQGSGAQAHTHISGVEVI